MRLWVVLAVAFLLAIGLFLGGKLPHIGGGGPALAEQGQFAILQAGSFVGEESFQLQKAQGGEALTSSIWIGLPGQRAPIIENQRLELTADWIPTRYSLSVQSPAEKQVDVTLSLGQAELQVTTGAGQPTLTTLKGKPPLLLMDTLVFSHYLPLYRLIQFIQAQAPDKWQGFEASVVLPQPALVLPLRVQTPSLVILKSGNRTIRTHEYLVKVGDSQFTLYGNDQTLLLVNYPGGAILAYRADLLPQGIEIPASSSN